MTNVQATRVVSKGAPPVAESRQYEVPSPNGAREDKYYWLRDDTRKDAAMLAYLNAENTYKDAMLAPVRADQKLLFDEIVARIKQDDSTVPMRRNGYYYYSRFEKGGEYPVYARKRGSVDAPEQVLLDGPAMAKGLGFFQVGDYQVSPDNKLIAWAEDSVGRRQYVLKIKNLETGEMLKDQIANIESDTAWANDNKTILYIEKDAQTLLGYRVRKHVLGTDPAADPVVYEEKDHAFYMGVERSRSNRYLYIGLRSTVSSEQWCASLDDPELKFNIILPRERDHEYEAEDFGDRWVVRTNYQAKNFRIVGAPMANITDRSAWRDIVAHRDDAFVQDFSVFKNYLAISERSGGLRNVRLKRWSDGHDSVIRADEPAYTSFLRDNPETETDVVRYYYTSLTTPGTTYDYDMNTGKRTMLKRDPVLGEFSPDNYTSEFVQATARDGVKVPVSIVYRKGFKRNGAAALYQYGYGSYGSSTDPAFSSSRLSLLDRGVVFAIAHIRGGQEMGRKWYEDGKLLNKVHTFTDFIDVTDFLVREKYAAPGRVVAMGGSAGGLLVGAVMNMAPDRYKAIAAHVPFVDVVTTMLDESIPLTTNEFDEWGNPKEKKYYDYMLSYSPYDHVVKQAYPATLVTTGLWDSQVQYFEPAKWVAKLRAMKTDHNPLIFRVNMEAGHGGKSGRFQRQEETAEEFAFLLDQAGVKVGPLPAAAANAK
ncbi:MAG: S9 family peptidase [Planctomycetes bacterium]|nr:S9 family peptidase [Planctomycetota bacterium]